MLKVIELFAGIGAQAAALENLNIPHQVIGISEIDKDALNAYYKIHNNNALNFGDIKEIKELPQCDLLTYSFPCSDISSAGSQKGFKGQKSSLLYEVNRLLLKAKEQNRLPKFLLLENVKALVSKKFIKDFEKQLEFLESLGYKNYWKVLDAKDYGVPQHRERVFVISKFEGDFVFPEKVKCPEIEEFLCQDDELAEWTFSPTKDMSENVIENIPDENKTWIIDNVYKNSRLPKYYNFCPTITVCTSSRLMVWDKTKLRRLDTREEFRLMGFTDEQYDACKTGKRTVDGKLIGNSICVPVLEAIFKEMFKE